MITPNMIHSLHDTITDLMNLANIGTLNEYQADKAQIAIGSIELMILDEVLSKEGKKNEINRTTQTIS